MSLVSKDADLFEPNYAMYTAMDADYPIFVWHDGTPLETGTAVTAATITVSGDTSITLAVNAAVDTRIGSSGVIAHATWGTWGAIADEINGVSGWHCVLRDCTRADLPDHMTAMSATDCLKKEVGVVQDNSDDYVMCCGISNYKYGTSTENQRCAIYSVTGQITSTNTPVMTVYDCDIKNRTQENVYQFILTSATEQAFPTYLTGEPFYVTDPGHRIVVHMEGVDNLSAGRLNVIGGIIDA